MLDTKSSLLSLLFVLVQENRKLSGGRCQKIILLVIQGK